MVTAATRFITTHTRGEHFFILVSRDRCWDAVENWSFTQSLLDVCRKEILHNGNLKHWWKLAKSLTCPTSASKHCLVCQVPNIFWQFFFAEQTLYEGDVADVVLYCGCFRSIENIYIIRRPLGCVQSKDPIAWKNVEILLREWIVCWCVS